jgi:molybdate transport system substrate-binding protein
VALGEAPLGIVYATDARAEDAVTVVGSFPDDSHPPIVYPVALTAASTSDASQGFLDYLATPEARASFEAWGFTVRD